MMTTTYILAVDADGIVDHFRGRVKTNIIKCNTPQPTALFPSPAFPLELALSDIRGMHLYDAIFPVILVISLGGRD